MEHLRTIVGVGALPIIKKHFISRAGPETTAVLVGANEASAQGLQNALYNRCHTKFLIKLWAFENRQFCMGTVWGQVV
jgi:hypothetical protein